MRPIFIASLGNPGSTYAHTLHSAGHTLLAAIISYTSSSPLSVSRAATNTKGRFSSLSGYEIAFWESPSYMNDSGPDLATAWRTWSSRQRAWESESTGELLEPRLVIVHDELELPAGKFSIKTSAGASARGHNGLKSFLAMPMMKQLVFTRVGVGIGPRPASREPDQVAKYVLKKMSGEQKGKIEGVAEQVWREIEKIGRGEEGKKKGGGGGGQQKTKERRGKSVQPKEKVEEGSELGHVRSHSV